MIFGRPIPDSRAAASNPHFRTCLLSDFDHTWRLLAGFGKAAPGV